MEELSLDKDDEFTLPRLVDLLVEGNPPKLTPLGKSLNPNLLMPCVANEFRDFREQWRLLKDPDFVSIVQLLDMPLEKLVRMVWSITGQSEYPFTSYSFEWTQFFYNIINPALELLRTENYDNLIYIEIRKCQYNDAPRDRMMLGYNVWLDHNKMNDELPTKIDEMIEQYMHTILLTNKKNALLLLKCYREYQDILYSETVNIKYIKLLCDSLSRMGINNDYDEEYHQNMNPRDGLQWYIRLMRGVLERLNVGMIFEDIQVEPFHREFLLLLINQIEREIHMI